MPNGGRTVKPSCERGEEPLPPKGDGGVAQHGEGDDRPFQEAEIDLAPARASRKLDEPDGCNSRKFVATSSRNAIFNRSAAVPREQQRVHDARSLRLPRNLVPVCGQSHVRCSGMQS